MKSYLKSLTKTLYDKVQRVVQDQYIEPITECQVYAIVNRKRIKSSHKVNKGKALLQRSDSSVEGNVLEQIDRLGLVSPEREFNLIGENYSVEVVSYRLKQLKLKWQAVKQHMLNTYSTNLQCIQNALLQIQTINNLSQTKSKSLTLRQNLSQLKLIIIKTQKITTLNIKLKNIKSTLKLLDQIPNIKKMSLFELRNIDLGKVGQFRDSVRRLYNKSKEGELKCVEHLEGYVDRVAGEQLRRVVERVKEGLVGRFDGEVYKAAVRDFVAGKSNVEYQKLLVRLIQGQVRDKIQQQCNMLKCQQQNSLLRYRLQKYITLLINLSKIYRWHRLNSAVIDTLPQQTQQKLRLRTNSTLSNSSNTSHQHQPSTFLPQNQNAIHIHTEQIKSQICQLMDQCLKEELESFLFGDTVKNQEIFEILVMVESFFEVAFGFSAWVFEESKGIVGEMLMRRVYKVQETAVRELDEAMAKEDQAEWVRLPVFRNYRYKSLQRTIQKVKRLSLYDKIPSLTPQNFPFFNLSQQHQQQSFQLLLAQRKQSTFQLKQLTFPHQKLQPLLFQPPSDPLPQHQDPEVVICKPTLTILSAWQQLLAMYCYFPLEEVRRDILSKMTFYLEHYMYGLLKGFLSEMYMKFFVEKYEQLELQYLQVRVKVMYDKVGEFLEMWQREAKGNEVESNCEKGTENKRKVSLEMGKYMNRGYAFVKGQVKSSKVSQENSVKARAISVESVRYLISYLKHIISHIQKFTTDWSNQAKDGQNQSKDESTLSIFQTTPNNSLTFIRSKILFYSQLQCQLSDLLLTDITPLTTNITFISPIIKKIKWPQIHQHPKQLYQYTSIIMKTVKQTYQKMKSMSKGQLPSYLVQRVFTYYWKTLLTFVMKGFLEDCVGKGKGGRQGKLGVEKLVDGMWGMLGEVLEGERRGVGKGDKGSGRVGSSKLLALAMGNNNNSNSSSNNNNSSNNNSSNTNTLSSNPNNTATTSPLLQTYLKIKSIFPILLTPNWPQCLTLLSTCISNLQFIYKIQLAILKASQCSVGISQQEMEQRVSQIEDIVRKRVEREYAKMRQ